MHSRGDCRRLEPGLHFIARIQLDRILGMGAEIAGWRAMPEKKTLPQQAAFRKHSIIAGRHYLPLLELGLEDRQLGEQHGRLQGVQARIDTDTNMEIALCFPVPRNLARAHCELCIIGEDGAAIAIAP